MERVSGDNNYQPLRNSASRDFERFIGEYCRVFVWDDDVNKHAHTLSHVFTRRIDTSFLMHTLQYYIVSIIVIIIIIIVFCTRTRVTRNDRMICMSLF